MTWKTVAVVLIVVLLGSCMSGVYRNAVRQAKFDQLPKAPVSR